MVLLALVLALWVATAAAGAPSCNGDSIFACLLMYLDSNSDGVISESEFNGYILNAPCGVALYSVTGATALEECDANHNGVIDASDMTAPFGCLNSLQLQTTICRECDRCAAYVASPLGQAPAKKRNRFISK